MEEEKRGYVRLWRKTLNNKIFRKDATAWRVFEYLLMKADYKTGKLTIGRFIGSQELSIPPTTFRDALKRLEKEGMIKTFRTPPQRFTTILISKWYLYQSNTAPIVASAKHKTAYEVQAQPPPHYKEEEYKERNLNKTLKIGNRDFTLKDLNRKYLIDTSEGRYRGGFEDWLSVFKRAWITR